MPVVVTTLTQRADFVRLRAGRKYTTSFFIIRQMPSNVSGQTHARVGLTVTNKCGNAVVRNRTKRRLRALVREIFPAHAKAGVDYIIVALDRAEPNIAKAAFDDIRQAMKRAIVKVHA